VFTTVEMVVVCGRWRDRVPRNISVCSRMSESRGKWMWFHVRYHKGCVLTILLNSEDSGVCLQGAQHCPGLCSKACVVWPLHVTKRVGTSVDLISAYDAVVMFFCYRRLRRDFECAVDLAVSRCPVDAPVRSQEVRSVSSRRH
jgi:hypothetical protein